MSQNNEKRTIGKVTNSAAAYGGITGLAVLSIIWGFNEFAGIELPEFVAMFIVVLAGYVANLFGGWIVKPGDGKRRADG